MNQVWGRPTARQAVAVVALGSRAIGQVASKRRTKGRGGAGGAPGGTPATATARRGCRRRGRRSRPGGCVGGCWRPGAGGGTRGRTGRTSWPRSLPPPGGPDGRAGRGSRGARTAPGSRRSSRATAAGRTTATTTSTTRISSRPERGRPRWDGWGGACSGGADAGTPGPPVIPVVRDAGRTDLEHRGAGLVADAAVAEAERPGPLDDGAVAVGAHALDVDLEVAVALEEVVEVGPDRLAALMRRVGRLVVDGVGGIRGGRPVGVADLEGLAELLEVVGRADRAGVDLADLGMDGDTVLLPGRAAVGREAGPLVDGHVAVPDHGG